MPNSKHTPPALRLIVTETGAQYPAFADGTLFPKVTFTTVTQTTDESLQGIASIRIEMFVFPPDKFKDDIFARFQNGILQFGENQIELKTWELKAQDPDLSHLLELCFTTTVYPDPTTI